MTLLTDSDLTSARESVSFHAEGFWASRSFNLESALFGPSWNRSTEVESYPELGELFEGFYVGSFGVVPDLATLETLILPVLAASSRSFAVGVTRVAKDADNVGVGGGWRWHKWGEYVTAPGDTRQPTMEYLDDEEGFADGVYVYEILEVLDTIS